jgi:hypothetical protein
MDGYLDIAYVLKVNQKNLVIDLFMEDEEREGFWLGQLHM